MADTANIDFCLIHFMMELSESDDRMSDDQDSPGNGDGPGGGQDPSDNDNHDHGNSKPPEDSAPAQPDCQSSHGNVPTNIFNKHLPTIVIGGDITSLCTH